MTALKLITRKFITFVTSVALLFLCIQTQSYAAGGLVVTPTRVEFNERTRSEKVMLLNTGAESASYRISFVRLHMLDDGSIINVKENEKGNFSDELIRYSPRQVTLPPGKSQVIRLMLRKPKDLVEGEYRSHMLFQALPEPRNTTVDIDDKNSDTISIEITPLIGITIPVIVRHGKLNASLSIEKPQYIQEDEKYSKPRLSVDLLRTGSQSTYGDIKVLYTPDGETNNYVVSQAKGVAVYTPNLKRQFKLTLERPAGISFENGTFRIIYTERNKNKKAETITEISLAIP